MPEKKVPFEKRIVSAECFTQNPHIKTKIIKAMRLCAEGSVARLFFGYPKYYNQLKKLAKETGFIVDDNKTTYLQLARHLNACYESNGISYELIPKQQGEHRNERAVNYIADFVYDVILPDGSLREVVEDCKGHKTKDYIIKRKLMLFIHNISIKET